MILVTVGTEQYPFNSLMKWVDLLIRNGLIGRDEEVVVQYGTSTFLPDGARVYRLLPEWQFRELVERARVVIAHCGEGTVMLLQSLRKPFVVVPRTKQFGEHVDDHQIEMADALERQGIPVARSAGALAQFLASPTLSTGNLQDYEDESELCEVLADYYPSDRYAKVLMVCSAGGHFKYAQSLRPFLDHFAHTSWVTFRSGTTESQLQDIAGNIHWAFSPTNRNIPNLVRNLWLAVQVVHRERPDLTITTGAGVGVPFLLIAKLLCGSKTVFVESKTRLQEISLSAKLLKACGALSRLVVRSVSLADRYPRSLCVAAPELDAGPAVVTTHSQQQDVLALGKTLLVTAPPSLDQGDLALVVRMLFKRHQQAEKLVLDLRRVEHWGTADLDVLIRSSILVKSFGASLVLWSVPEVAKASLAPLEAQQLFRVERSAARSRVSQKPGTERSLRGTILRRLTASLESTPTVAAPNTINPYDYEMPLGLLLQQAGLLSADQVAEALTVQEQSQCPRFGEVLIEQAWIKPETVDFFADVLPQLHGQPRRPIGEYLRQAGLMDEGAIAKTLAHQRNDVHKPHKRFGEIAAELGFVAQQTVNFLLESIADHYPKMPIGFTLQRAGLISPEQLVQVREIQAQSHHVLFGEVLVERGWLSQQTVDFFAERLPKLVNLRDQLPESHYLELSGLVDPDSLALLKQEQRQNNQSLFDLAVYRGVLTETTAEFLRELLGLSPSRRRSSPRLVVDSKKAARRPLAIEA
jgi:UDP-N-acetylglucosamine transferase subunit ALG13/anti-anti-sigma regulatory factor